MIQARIILAIYVLLSTATIICAEEQDHYELNERKVHIKNDDTIVTSTHIIIYIENKPQIQRFKAHKFTIDENREIIQLVFANCYEKDRLGEWTEVLESVHFQPQNQNSKSMGIQTYWLTLPDLSPPARIEYELKVTNHKPFIENHFWSMGTFGDGLPVKKAVYEITYPKDRKLFYMIQGFQSGPEITHDEEFTTYRWSLEDLPAHSKQISNLQSPAVAKSVFISSTPDWQPVAEYFTTEFEDRTAIFNNANGIIYNLTGGDIDNKDLNDTVAIVASAMKMFKSSPSEDIILPRPALKSLESKLGDCKDLAVLLVSLLRSAGIESYVVLISKDFKGDLENMLPYPYLFDHAIVYVPPQNDLEERIIVDPTDPSRKAPYSGTSGLVLKKSSPFFIRL